MKVIVLFESENDGIWIDETEICGDFGLKRVKNRIRRMIMMKIMKIVATTHEAKFVLPDDLCCLFMVVVGGGGGGVDVGGSACQIGDLKMCLV